MDKSSENDYKFLASENGEFSTDKNDNDKIIFEDEQKYLNKNIFENLNNLSNDIGNNIYNIDECNYCEELSLNKITHNNSLKELFKENMYSMNLILIIDIMMIYIIINSLSMKIFQSTLKL